MEENQEELKPQGTIKAREEHQDLQATSGLPTEMRI
jgi:hypothetical protein